MGTPPKSDFFKTLFAWSGVNEKTVLFKNLDVALTSVVIFIVNLFWVTENTVLTVARTAKYSEIRVERQGGRQNYFVTHLPSQRLKRVVCLRLRGMLVLTYLEYSL